MVTEVTAFQPGSLMLHEPKYYILIPFHSSKTKKEKHRPAVHCRPFSRHHRYLFRSNRRHLAVIAVTKNGGLRGTESK
jgi:hypothetical protein